MATTKVVLAVAQTYRYRRLLAAKQEFESRNRGGEMRQFAFITTLLLCGITYQNAWGQGFLYVPPGADYGYHYGLDAGSGLGFGYGFGLAGYGMSRTPGDAVANSIDGLNHTKGQYFSSGQVSSAGDYEPDFDVMTNATPKKTITHFKQAKSHQKAAKTQQKAKALKLQQKKEANPQVHVQSEHIDLAPPS